VAGQAGVDGDLFKLLRDLGRKARASSRASSLRDNPPETCSFYIEKEAGSVTCPFSFYFLKPYVPNLCPGYLKLNVGDVGLEPTAFCV
jgi:hypothetical protein